MLCRLAVLRHALRVSSIREIAVRALRRADELVGTMTLRVVLIYYGDRAPRGDEA
jgi:hypothetical protein